MLSSQINAENTVEGAEQFRDRSIMSIDQYSGKRQSKSNSILANMIIKFWLWAFFLTLIYLTSYLLSSHYIYGDQVHYRNFYESLVGTNVREILVLQVGMTGGAEPLFGYTMWLGANFGITKDVWISIINTLFAVLIIVTLRRFKVSVFFIFLILTNYYFLVLMTAAERLKFSYIILLLIALSSGWIRTTLLLAAPFFHFQTLLNYSSYLAEYLARINFSRRIKRKTLLLLPLIGGVSVLAAAALLLTFLHEVLLKVDLYTTKAQIDLIDNLNLLILLAIGTTISKHRARFILAMAPIIIAVTILGPDRVNMIGVVVFFHFFLREGKSSHPILLLILAYFSVRGIIFAEMVISQGTGFL